MADEEEIEIKGADDITPEEIDPEDLIDVEGDIDPEELLEVEDDLEVDPDVLVVDPIITDEGSTIAATDVVKPKLQTTKTTKTTFILKTMLRRTCLQSCKKNLRRLKRLRLKKRKKLSAMTAQTALSDFSRVDQMRPNVSIVSCWFDRMHLVAR